MAVEATQAQRLERLQSIADRGAMTAARGLSLLLDRQVAIKAPSVSIAPVEAVYDQIGGPEAEVVGIYLLVGGDVGGHIMLMFPIAAAREMVGLLVGEGHGQTEFDELSLSALGEVGNIVGSAFLNHLGDYTGLTLQPSPPLVVVEMAGALLDTLLTEIMSQGKDIFIIDAAFFDQDRATSGLILITPDPRSIDTLLASLG